MVAVSGMHCQAVGCGKGNGSLAESRFLQTSSRNDGLGWGMFPNPLAHLLQVWCHGWRVADGDEEERNNPTLSFAQVLAVQGIKQRAVVRLCTRNSTRRKRGALVSSRRLCLM